MSRFFHDHMIWYRIASQILLLGREIDASQKLGLTQYTVYTYRMAQNFNLVAENFGGLLIISILVDKTLVDWLPCTAK